jgi:glycosyltransferase involved in cell wall biosynthesis
MQQYLLTCVSPEARTTIHMHGNVEQAKIRSALQSANLAVFPSYSEAFALAPMEAMAEGCPTIYSRRASGTELIEHGRNGLLIDPDDVQGIAQSILRVLRDQRLAAELGREARDTILGRFSPAAMIQKNIDFYERCIRAFRQAENEPGPHPESVAQIAS